MSRSVKVDGMEVKTKVSGNLLISDSNISDSYYGTQLNQSKVALLEPVSSINGTTGSFYYTLDASADGSKRTATSVKAYDVCIFRSSGKLIPLKTVSSFPAIR